MTLVAGEVIDVSEFSAYMQQESTQKSQIIQSGAITIDPELSAFLASGGLTHTLTSWTDPTDDDEVASDTVTDGTVRQINADGEVVVRCSRNTIFESNDISAAIAGDDPVAALVSRLLPYQLRRLTAMFISQCQGIFHDNQDNDSGDMAFDNRATPGGDLGTGGAYTAGVTDFSAEAFIDALATMGDEMDEDVALIMCHPDVYAQMRKQNLIDSRPDSEMGRILEYDGARVIKNRNMPTSSGEYETWIFGQGAFKLGLGTPKNPLAFDRNEKAYNGSGVDIVVTRWEAALHAVGTSYTGSTSAKGGPTNATLELPASFDRVYPEREQVKMVRLLTTES
jgi:hypothetical protein